MFLAWVKISSMHIEHNTYITIYLLWGLPMMKSYEDWSCSKAIGLSKSWAFASFFFPLNSFRVSNARPAAVKAPASTLPSFHVRCVNMLHWFASNMRPIGFNHYSNSKWNTHWIIGYHEFRDRMLTLKLHILQNSGFFFSLAYEPKIQSEIHKLGEDNYKVFEKLCFIAFVV